MRTVIHVTGPESEQDKWGDEIPVWHAVKMDEETEEELESWTFHGYDEVLEFCQEIEETTDISIEFDAMEA